MAGTSTASDRDRLNSYLRRSLMAGTSIVVPVLITGFVLLFAINFLSGLLDPLVIPIQDALGDKSPLLPQIIAVGVLLVTIFAVGAFNESSVGRNRLKERLDRTMSQIPGVSSIYGPLDQMSEMLFEGDTDNFQEVVLVEFPKEGSYSVAFQTSHPPDSIVSATPEADMITVFMPMGPNPFMGGFIMHLAEDEVYHLDLSIEEGISSIVSFGVAVEVDEHPPPEIANDMDRYGEEA
jgi:uncharacterized membrane protein